MIISVTVIYTPFALNSQFCYNLYNNLALFHCWFQNLEVHCFIYKYCSYWLNKSCTSFRFFFITFFKICKCCFYFQTRQDNLKRLGKAKLIGSDHFWENIFTTHISFKSSVCSKRSNLSWWKVKFSILSGFDAKLSIGKCFKKSCTFSGLFCGLR